MLLYYRYNTVILEVGGAMEYKRHPEINESWESYCCEMARIPSAPTRCRICSDG